MIRVILICLFVILWFGNSPGLQKIYDVKDYYGYVGFVTTRFKVYEFMFLLLSVVCVLSNSGNAKAISFFASILIAGSLIDKVVFGVTGYLLADIVLIVMALFVSVIVYRNERSKLVRKPSKLVT